MLKPVRTVSPNSAAVATQRSTNPDSRLPNACTIAPAAIKTRPATTTAPTIKRAPDIPREARLCASVTVVAGCGSADSTGHGGVAQTPTVAMRVLTDTSMLAKSATARPARPTRLAARPVPASARPRPPAGELPVAVIGVLIGSSCGAPGGRSPGAGPPASGEP